MLIKKLGHCCLLIKTEKAIVLTDPGTYSHLQDTIKGIDIILITHEHQDHFHIDSVKKILLNNPEAKIITNNAVGELLDAEEIPYDIVSEGEKSDEYGVLIEGYGHKHEIIYGEFGQVENTGYFIDGKLFYPGDAFTYPDRFVDILALPVAGPWMKISEAIDYCLAVKPRTSFPVHDGGLKQPGVSHRVTSQILFDNGIGFVPMIEGEEKEI